MDSQKKDLIEKLRKGDISRRDFVQMAGILGISIGAAGCSSAGKATRDPGIQDRLEGLTTVPTSPYQQFIPKESPTSITYPKVDTWVCIVCGERFHIKEDMQNHMLDYHARLLPEITEVDEPTFNQFLEKPKRFDEKNTVFSRAAWDEKLKKRIGSVIPHVQNTDPKIMEGKALIAGAIQVDNKAGNFHDSYYGYFGHLQGSDGLFSWEEEVTPNRIPEKDPVKLTERIKEVAKFYGASLVGVTEVNPLWIYENYYEPFTGNSGPVELNYKYAIMMAIEMNWDMASKSPDPGGGAAAALGYSRMAEIASSLAKYIRMLGYEAIPSGNESGQMIPMAVEAGLGEVGRMGLLLTPEFGPRQRLFKVFTNIPLVPDKPIDFGIQSYCETCHICAQACPARAIPFEERSTKPTSISNRTGIKRWTVNVEDCYIFWQENGGIACGNCVAACPWSLQPRRNIY
jgi:epoxyqueuosine reductase